MSSLQAFYAGAFNSTGLTTTLANVLEDGNIASKDINMGNFQITHLKSITNSVNPIQIVAPAGLSLNNELGTTNQYLGSNVAGQPTWKSLSTVTPDLSTVLNAGAIANQDINMGDFQITHLKRITNSVNPIEIVAPAGLSLNNSVGTSGVSVLVSGGTGQPVWVNGISATPTLNQVMVVSGNVTTENINSTANITANNINLKTPLSTSYSTLSYPVNSGSVGSSVSVRELTGLPFTTTGSSVWETLFTSSTILNLGVYIISVKTLFEGISQNGDFGLGIVSNSTETEPAYGTPTEFRNVPSVNNFTCCFVSSTGFQSPKFLYLSDTPGVTINQVEWTAVKFG